MLRIIGSQLRHRPGRAMAILLGIVMATTGFTVLTANTSAARLEVAGEVDAHARGAYEILVRPAGSRSALEQQRALLRPNFLTSQYGGITRAQWRDVAGLPGVEVAAPSAMLGYAGYMGVHRFDLTAAVDPGLTRQVIRQRQIRNADRQLTTAAAGPSLVYVTRRPVRWLADEAFDAPTRLYSDGRRRTKPCGAGQPWPSVEVTESGDESPVCLSSPGASGSPVPAVSVHRDEQGRFHFLLYGQEVVSDRLDPPVLVSMSFSVGAVDPDAEAALVGLRGAMVSGHYLESDTGEPVDFDGPVAPIFAVATTDPGVDETLFVRAERLALTPSAGAGGLQAAVDAGPVAHTHDSATVSAYEIQQAARHDGQQYAVDGLVDEVARPGPVDYDVDSDGRLIPRTNPPASDSWRGTGAPPPLWSDTSLRVALPPPAAAAAPQLPPVAAIDAIGYFDPEKLTRFDQLAQAPLEFYDANRITGATAADRDLLGGQQLGPNSNPGGYVSAPPTFLISLDTLATLTGAQAPISAIRVRVADVTGFDPVSRERVRVVADEISQHTGLDVEVTFGSSPSAQQVLLPAGRYGRPQLRLAEEWVHKGVAAAVVQAADRKSVVLFVLVLVVCVLFVANAVSAALRHRRAELAVLSCLGWPRWRVGALLIGEVAVLGLLAGLAGSALAVPIGLATASPVSAGHALWAAPVGAAVAVVAAVVPAWRASGARPLAAVRDAPRDAGAGRLRVPGGVAGIAVANLYRVPGRTALGAAALAIGAAGVTVLASVIHSFHGRVTGSLLGEAVSVRVRGVDEVVVAATVVLGLVALADVLYLNIRERRQEYAVLRATGWTASVLRRLVTYEGLVIGVLGAAAGAAVGLAAAARFAGHFPDDGGWIAAAVAGAGVLAAGLGALVPAVLLSRLNLAASLTDQ